MTLSDYEPLSALDAVFLAIEDRSAPMHVASVSLLDAAPLRQPDGTLDVGRIEQTMLQILPRHRRLRQRVWWPSASPPVWVDDARFDPRHHLHRIAVPYPGTRRELDPLLDRILSAPLDLDRPLWEAWLIEGLEGDRLGIVWKLHHCLADGVSVREMLIGYLGFEPSSEVPPLAPFEPRGRPGSSQIRLDHLRASLESWRQLPARMRDLLPTGALVRHGDGPRSVGALLTHAARGLSEAAEGLGHAAEGLIEIGSNLLAGTAPTPFNGVIGPHRRFGRTACSFEALREVRKESGAKINDVVLAAVCGATRRFFLGRGVAVDDLPFRVLVPVSMRGHGAEVGGNQVSNLIAPLPLHETDPRRRLQSVLAATTRAKASGQVDMADTLLAGFDALGLRLPAPLARKAAERSVANLVVTNIPGPPVPQYLLEARLLESYPLVPLAHGQGLGIALYSYDQTMHWGFNADRDLLPDLDDFVKAIDIEIDQLIRAHAPLVVRTRPSLQPPRNRRKPMPTEHALATRQAV